MALFEYAEKIGLVNESLSYKVKKGLKNVKYSFQKNLILSGEFDKLKKRLTDDLAEAKDLSDITSIKKDFQSAIPALHELYDQAKKKKLPENVQKQFTNESIKNFGAYIRWLETTYAKMVEKKEKDLSK